MYLLEDETEVTQQIRNAFKRGQTRAYIKLGNTIIDQDNYLINAKYRDEKADTETGQFIGVTSMRELTIKLYNYENTFNLENQEVEYFVGAKVGNEYKYINFGTFIVQKPENEEVNEETTFTALDYMSKFDGEDEYVPQVNFPTTLLGLTQDICRQSGVVLGNTDFRNANMQILANPFINGENCRTVLKSIAKVAFSPAYIGQDDKLYIKFDISDSPIENITIDDFFENKPNDNVKPITAITLRSSEVKASGQTAYASQEMIEEYGINELIIEEDYLAYTDTLRNAYLTGAATLFGLTYVPLTVDLLGSIYLSHNDVIKITNLQENEYITYCLNNNHEFNGTLYNTISVPALTETEEKYKYKSEDDTYKTKTAIEIDKANQRITSVVANVGEQDQKISQITQTVDELNSKISDIADISISEETNIAQLSFEDINASEPIRIEIHPLVQNISYLYPAEILFPSSNTFLKTRTLRFTNINDNIIVDYELPCDLYYYDAEHYDEFILDYDSQTCIVNKKVGINANGTTYLLNEQRTIEYDYPTIPLTNGDYQVSLLGYEAGYLFVRLMVQNIYTTQFATRAEMNSAISQSATAINLSVDYKLTAYPTTVEMNSAINMTASSITASVSATYATKNAVTASLELKIDKDDNDQIVSMINASADRITLSAGRLVINSGNFQLNSAGNITCNGGRIAGWTITNDSLDSQTTGMSNGHGAAFYVKLGNETPFLVSLSGDLQCKTLLINGAPTMKTSAEEGKQVITYYVDGNQLVTTTINASYIVMPDRINSDRNKKKEIKSTNINGLDIIKNIDFVQFDWKGNGEHEPIGVIAQDVEKICKDLVSDIKLQDGTDTKVFNNFRMIFINSKATQELYSIIQKQQEEINYLKERIK